MNSSCPQRRRTLRSRTRKRRRVTKRKFNGRAEAEDRRDVYERVTARIIADLEKGVRPWMQPWNAGNTDGRITKPLRHDGQPYRGVNILMLWASAIEHGFASPTWMTYKQSQQLGAHVRKGERGSLVVYANRVTKTETTDAGEEVEREIPFLKGYTVFNVEQIDGLPESYYDKPPPPKYGPMQKLAHVDAYIGRSGALILPGGNRAYYALEPDHIRMPLAEAFDNAESFYATLLHELTHWTRHPSRLDRDFGRKRWGDEGYAREELVAEIASAFLCADLEITPEIREDHAAYVASWLKVLKDDKRAIFSAASHAQRAVDYLNAFQPAPEPAAAPQRNTEYRRPVPQ